MKFLKTQDLGLVAKVLILALPFLGGIVVGSYPAEYHAFCSALA